MVVINLRCRTRESCGHYFFCAANLSRQHATDCWWGRFWYPLLISKSPISLHSWRFCLSSLRSMAVCWSAQTSHGVRGQWNCEEIGAGVFIFLAVSPLIRTRFARAFAASPFNTGPTQPRCYAGYCLSSAQVSGEARRVKNAAETTRKLFPQRSFVRATAFFPLVKQTASDAG